MKGLFKLINPDKPLGGRFKIISELGAGGFGQTFVAEDLHLPAHPRCVVKQLKPQHDDPETLQTARRLFDLEAEVLYELGQHHDQIPCLLAHFEDNQEFYLAQELIEGESLTQELKGEQLWTQTQVIDLLQDLLYVLAYVHEKSVIHRDIKPSNLIRRRSDGKVVLIDFGAVKQVSTQFVDRTTGLTKTISIGTKGYTPKEQSGGNPRFSSDVYAVGMIAIQALTKIHPRHLPEDHQTGEITWRHHAPHISPEFAAFIDRTIRYDFRQRYSTAAEALRALQSLSSSNGESVPPTQPSFDDIGDLPTQTFQPSTTRPDTTESGTEQDPTNIWIPTDSSAGGSATQTTESGTEQTPTRIWESPNPSAESSATQATESGTEQSPTNLWVPSTALAGPQATQAKSSGTEQTATQLRTRSQSSVQLPPPVTSTGSTAPLEQSQYPQHSSVDAAPTVTTATGIQRQPFLLWSMLTVLAAVGSTFLVTKTMLSPQFVSQSADRIVVPIPRLIANPAKESPSPSPANPTAESPSPNAAEKPASPSPASPVAESPTSHAAEKPLSSSPASPATESPTPSAVEKPKSSASTRPPVATQPSPTPAPPVIKATSPRKEPPVTELLGQADRLREGGQYEKALNLYEQVVASKPDSAEAQWGRCYSLNSLEQSTDAIAACNKALQLKPNYPEALWSKGTALDQQQNYPEALKTYEQATALKPDFAEAWNNQGVTLLKLNRPQEALSAFKKATEINPNFADAWANRGAALWELKRFALAIASLNRALQIQPDNPTALKLRQQAREQLRRS
ncbi:MAG TPA: tetratricopeptide repeat protein [Chroococcales cyanobacterium]